MKALLLNPIIRIGCPFCGYNCFDELPRGRKARAADFIGSSFFGWKRKENAPFLGGNRIL